MNCRPGDIAIIVPPYKDEPVIGFIVKVLHAAEEGAEMFSRGNVFCSNRGSGALGWVVDASGPGFPRYIGDMYLRPIRGSSEEDEMITIAGKPQKEPA